MKKIVALTLVFSASAGAQIPVRQLGTPEAVSRDTVGFLYGVRELSDGRLVANDARSRRLMLFDSSLGSSRIIADSITGSEQGYGRSSTGIIPYLADSTLLIDLVTRAFLVVDPKGAFVRVMSPPRPSDIGYMWNPGLGTPGFDPSGKLVYRTWIMPAFKAPEAGKPFVAPEMPDSAPLLRGDFDTRVADTIAWIRIPKMRISTTPQSNGSIVFRPMINPVASIDDWTLLADGTVAILRGQDYHIDWIGADGKRWSTPKMPFDWKRLTDAEKRAIVDSTRVNLERQLKSGELSSIPGVPAGHGGASAANHSMTVTTVQGSDGDPRPRNVTATPTTTTQTPDVVSPGDLPDYMPPVMRSGTMKADFDGNIWILPSTSSQAAGGLLYDVVNRKGEVFQRVRLPAGRALEGFGAGGAIYLTSHDAGGARIERARLRASANSTSQDQ